MRKFKLAGIEEITPGATKTYNIPVGRYLGLLVRLTGTTDTSQTLALADVGGLRVQRNGTVIQNETFGFYSQLNNLMSGYPEAVLPTAGATKATVFIPFFAPGLKNTMEVTSTKELVLFFDPAAGLATDFGSNAITVTVYGVEETSVAESYQLDVFTQDEVAAATGLKTVPINKNNIAYLFLQDLGGDVSTIQFDVDDRTILPSVHLDVLAAWAAGEWKIEATGNTLVPIRTGSINSVGSYLNASATLSPTFTGTGTLEITAMSIQKSPAGVVEISNSRVKSDLTESARLASRKI